MYIISHQRMKVRILLFAYLKETLGMKEEVMDIQKGSKVRDLWNRFKHRIQGGENLRILFAVNGEYVEVGKELKEGDEVAFIPPVSGG